MSKYITLDNLKKFLQTLQSSYSATVDKFGGIKIGYQNTGNNTAVQLDGEGKAFVAVSPYELQVASSTALGGIKIGYDPTSRPNTSAVQLDGEGKAFVAVSPYELQVASSTALGGIKIGYQNTGNNTAVQLDEHGKAFVAVSPYELQVASSTVLGGIKVGQNSGLTVDNDILTLRYLPNLHPDHDNTNKGDVNDCMGDIQSPVFQFYHLSNFHDNMFPISSIYQHANSLLWIGSHTGTENGNHGHQLGFSGNGQVYHRSRTNGQWNNSGQWDTILDSQMVSLNTGDNALTQIPEIPTDGDYVPVELTTGIASQDARSQKLVVKVPYQSLSVQSVDKGNVVLENGKMMTFVGWNGRRISSGLDDNVISISGFSGHQAGKVSKYYLQITTTDYEDIQNTISVPLSVKWANGVPPFMSPGSIIEIIFTSTDGTTYTGVWAKYY